MAIPFLDEDINIIDHFIMPCIGSPYDLESYVIIFTGPIIVMCDSTIIAQEKTYNV